MSYLRDPYLIGPTVIFFACLAITWLLSRRDRMRELEDSRDLKRSCCQKEGR